MQTPLKDRLKPNLPVADTQATAAFWSNLGAADVARLEPCRPFFDGVVAGSSYLAELVRRDVGFALRCFEEAPEHLLGQICSEVAEARKLPVADVAPVLRKAKARFALLCALADLGNAWPLEAVTAAITRFADACIATGVSALLLDQCNQGKFNPPDAANPAVGSGYVVLAMGKHGAFELNYSSDVDLIVLYDAATPNLPAGAEVTRFFVKLTQRLVALLQDVTVDGYAFRTDLRLRPDPRATQIAISIESAANYYEYQGQNWERAAFIKARAIAGDIVLGEEFLDRLKPYIWRKYLDFAAISDIQSLIRQIHAVKGHGEIAVEGHNLKLGRGGIREIEFFVQTQQLIAGGRNPELRGRGTLAMLDALASAQWITRDTASDLKQAYVLLRTLEHRAQMLRDEQTHSVPAGQAFAAYARFCGWADVEAFRSIIRTTLETVRNHSSRLFEKSANLGGDAGALVFTGGEDDPETLETLQRMGFASASEVSATIRAWHFGRYAATRDKRSKEALTELMPKLLQALSQAGSADRTFLDFDAFLRGLPAGVQLFAMLKSQPGLLDLLAQILGTAPRLAQGLGRQPRILEAVLDPGFFGPLPTLESLAAQAAMLMTPGLPLDEAMDRMRVFGREQKFRVGVRVLSETVSAEEAGQAFAGVAEVALQSLLAAVEANMAESHGIIEGARVAVVAMGKLGGREMTSGSDLDLIVVYDHPEGDSQSTGKRPLWPGQYFTKLTQKLVAAVSAPTAEGSLYEVDLRLRPSGSKGPVAVNLPSFKSYQVESAWTWEKLALTRARTIAGDASLCTEIEKVKQHSLASLRDVETTRNDVLDMRGLMLKEQKVTSPWDIKRVRGGLVEAEFIAQYLQLVHAPATPSVLDTNTIAVFQNLREAGLLAEADAVTLVTATRLYHRLTQLLRLCLDQEYDPAQALPGLNRLVAQAAEMPDVKTAEDLLVQTQAAVALLFDRLVGTPKDS